MACGDQGAQSDRASAEAAFVSGCACSSGQAQAAVPNTTANTTARLASRPPADRPAAQPQAPMPKANSSSKPSSAATASTPA